MADMQQGTPAAEQQVSEVHQQKAAELQQLVAQQVMAADTSKPTTMTELLADEQGAFAAKAQELGLQQEWQKFKDAQPEIGKMREDFMALEEQRSAVANQVANISPQLEQEAAAVRKSSGIGGIVGAAVSGAASAFAASKVTQSKPIRIVAAAAGAVFGGAVTAIMTAKRSAEKRMGKIEEQVGNLGDIQPDPELEQKAEALQQKLGTAQQESMEGMIDSMIERMAQNEIAAQQAQEAAIAQQAAMAQAAEQAQQQSAAAAQQQQPVAALPAEQPSAAAQAAQQPEVEALLAQLHESAAQEASATQHQAPRPQTMPQPAGSHVEALAARSQSASTDMGRG